MFDFVIGIPCIQKRGLGIMSIIYAILYTPSDLEQFNIWIYFGNISNNRVVSFVLFFIGND